MLRMTKIGLLAALMTTAASTTAMAQYNPEQGDIDTNLPPRKPPPQPESAPRFTGTPGPLRVYGGFSVALGGELKVDGEETRVPNLDPTIGLQGGVDYVMGEYFSIGGETRALFWKPDGQAKRNFFWDIDVKPRGRYAFADLPLEIYGALPIGLTVPGLQDTDQGKIGWNIGLVGGVNYFFNENMGINAELGWLFHQYTYGVEGQTGTGSARMSQFLLLSPSFVYAL